MNTIRLVYPHQPSLEHKVPAPSPLRTIRITVEASAVTWLRQLAARICGEALEFIRISACDKGRRMKVCLCTSAASLDALVSAILQRLPEAEFGKLSMPAQNHA